ncbi:hypothetical protein Q5P01_002003 [Channa striata]|uniref:Protein kinase domain-containing protein n=1 Tax=Channa striata TaxID=64152 RepID=A0AA88NQA4_CHASR|nr:hypothetical protein Q5P01_002003 [Channa striata]
MVWHSPDHLILLKHPEVLVDQTLFGSSSEYFVLKIIGKGCFGTVAKCQNLATKQIVAIKILHEDTTYEKEVSVLKTISVLNPDNVNIVTFFEQFHHLGQKCLVFEMLDRNLYDHLKEQNWNPLSLNEIRPIAKQLLVALDALKGLGIVHSDIKPDNIMFVNMQDQPLRVKLLDFGEAIPVSNIKLGMELQPTGYRAPEVSLGLPFTEAIDVWGVGCILAFLYLAENLFPVECDYQMMKCMVEVLGQPEEHLLRAGLYTQYFFRVKKGAKHTAWRLMTPEEYLNANRVKPEERNSFIELPSSLDDLLNFYPTREADEFKDRRAFVHLMKQLLHLEGDQRISPSQALLHPFISMSHLPDDPGGRAYLTSAQTLMSICPLEDFMVNISPHSPAGSYIQVRASASAATVSYHSIPASWSSDRVLFTTCEKDRAASFSDEDQANDSCEETQSLSYASFTDGGPSCTYNQAVSPFDETKPTDFISAAPASHVPSKKLLSRIQTFFRHMKTFCCCWLPLVED